MDVKVGDKVRYSVAWLRSTGNYAGDVANAKGVVTAIQPLGTTSLAVVDWGNPNVPAKVLTSNLTIIGSPKERYESVASKTGESNMAAEDLKKRAELIVKRAQAAIAKHKNADEAQAIRQQVQQHIIALHELIGAYGWSDDALQSLDQFSAVCDQWLGALPEEL